jgi:hypothetical protein
VWYILEIHVDTPAPEQTINVSAVARKCVTVKIPIQNPKTHDCKFTVVLSDDDLFGQNTFTVPAKEQLDYNLIFSPLNEMKRQSSVYFYSDDDGEFWYSLKIEVTKAPEETLAPMSSPLGRYVANFILLENPLDKPVSFRVENTNPTAFHLIAKRVIQLTGKEKKRVEVRYIPCSIGIKDQALITFASPEIGDWLYNVTGVGKPPPPLSPTIVTSTLGNTNSALILFNNPFPYPARFSVSLSTSESDEVFKFLLKRKMFTLSNFDEEFQIPFTFTPVNLGQSQAHIVVLSLGPARGPLPKLEESPGIRWVFPLIGTGISNETPTVHVLHCRSQGKLDEAIDFTLSGETEIFEALEYALTLDIPPEYEFMNNTLDIRSSSIQRHEKAATLTVSIKFAPQRPLELVTPLKVKNPLGLEWSFDVHFIVDRGKPVGTITVESLLHKVGSAKIIIPTSFRQQTPFHAYFVAGSAVEFNIDQTHGFIEPGFGGQTELPSSIIFEPKMYGKVLKGLLVVDTLETQFLFDVIGKTPEYVPPVAEADSIRLGITSPPETKRAQTAVRKKRNIIKDNIENARIAKPHLPSAGLEKLVI